MDLNDRTRAVRTLAVVSRIFEHRLGDIGLSLPQYRLLAFLSKGEWAASRLADHLAVSRPTITSLVDGLVTKGLVERRQSDTDRRRVLHELTAAGVQALADADASLAAAFDELAGELEEPQALHDGVAALATAVERARARREEAPMEAGAR